MMQAFTAYIKTITALTIFSALVGILLPEGKYRRYGELVLGILILTAVLSPFLRLFGMGQEEFRLSSLENSIRFERELLSQDRYQQMEEERLEHTYQAVLEDEIKKDLQKSFADIRWVEADFCRETEEYGALKGFSIGCGTENKETVWHYAAKRYGLAEENILVTN